MFNIARGEDEATDINQVVAAEEAEGIVVGEEA